MLPEPTIAALPSASSAVARLWEAPAGWRHVRTLWASVGQFVRARGAKQPGDLFEPDPFATEMPFLTDRWPAGE